MDHNIKPVLQQTMDRRRGESVIGDADQVMAARDGGDSAESASFSSKVGGRFPRIMRVSGRIAASIPTGRRVSPSSPADQRYGGVRFSSGR